MRASVKPTTNCGFNRAVGNDAGDERRATRGGVEPFDVDARAFDHLLEHIGVADFVARLGGAVVDAAVADEGLQQLDGFVGEVVELAIVDTAASVSGGVGFPTPPVHLDEHDQTARLLPSGRGWFHESRRVDPRDLCSASQKYSARLMNLVTWPVDREFPDRARAADSHDEPNPRRPGPDRCRLQASRGSIDRR